MQQRSIEHRPCQERDHDALLDPPCPRLTHENTMPMRLPRIYLPHMLAALCLGAMALAFQTAPVRAQTSALGGFQDNGTAGGRAARSQNPAHLLDNDRARQLGTLDSQTQRLDQQRKERNLKLTEPCPSTTNPACREINKDGKERK